MSDLFAKAAALLPRYTFGDLLTRPSCSMTVIEPHDTDTVSAVKMAASVLDAVRALGRSANSHWLGSALYAPLVAADLAEMRHQRRAGKSGVLPALAGTALAVMMAQHMAPALEKAVKSPWAQKVMQRIGVK